MNVRTVLVVGAGIAGSTAAYWLARNAMAVTVVERAAGRAIQRQSGRCAWAGLPCGRADGSATAGAGSGDAGDQIQCGRRRGSQIGWVPMQLGDGIEIPRSDLAAILAYAGRDNADYLYSDSVVSLTDDGNGVDVTFEHAAPRRFDLVVVRMDCTRG
jgi:2-polyprenyl-6-methoxyphenol hydroxylase-like FAD-dependent oxidoreductase